MFTLAALPSGKAALSLVSPLGAEDVIATAVAALGKHGHITATVAALVTVAALGPVAAEKKGIDPDASGAIYQFVLSGYENASFSAKDGSATKFDVSSGGAVSRKENVMLETGVPYEVVVLAKDEGFLGAVLLTLIVHGQERVNAEFSAARYRAAMAGGYKGAVLTLSAADEGVSLSYLDGLGDSPFSLVSLSSGDYAVSLETAVSGPDVAVLEPRFGFHRTDFLSATLTADIKVTILGPYSDSAVIQHNAASVAYRFVVPGFAGATFEEVEGSGSNDGFYSVSSADGTISWSLSLTASVAHTIVVRGRDDGFVGDALFTLALSVSFCKADMERATEDDVATLNGKLLQAAKDGDAGLVCDLSQQGANVTAKGNDRNRKTPLHWAAENGHLDVVKYLSSHDDVDADAPNLISYTPLHLAADNGHLDVVKYLSSRGDVDADARSFFGNTPLRHAAGQGHLDVVKYLSSRGDVDVNVRGNHGITPLNSAAWNGRLDVVKYLSSRDDVDVNTQDKWGHTPLDRAVNRGDLEIATFLRARGGVCLIRTDEACGLVMRPFHFILTITNTNHSGAVHAVHTVTATDPLRPNAAAIYSLVHSGGFSLTVDSETGVLSLPADSEVLTSGLVATASIQAATEGGTQNLTVEVVIEVSLPPTLSSYPSLLTASSEYMGVLATLSATEEDVAMSYDSGLDEKVFTLTALPSGKAELSLVARLGVEDVTATAVVELSKYGHDPTLVTARVTVAALVGPVGAKEKDIDADVSGAIYQFFLPGYENAWFSAADGSATEFDVSSDGEVSRKEDVEVDAVYEVVVLAKDEGFLGAVSLALSVSVLRATVLRAEFSAARYRAAMAGGYEGAVLTLSAADEQVSLSYLGGLEDGSSFSLVSLSSGDYAVSLETAVSGPDIAALNLTFEFQRTGFPLVTTTADIKVTVLGPYSDSAMIQHNAASVAYRFVVPGFAGATFEEVEGSGSNDGFYSVSSADGTISWSLSLTASVSHTIVVRGRDDGFLGDALFTLALSVSFCKADMERASDDDVATLNDKLLQAAKDGDAGLVCKLSQQGANVTVRQGRWD